MSASTTRKGPGELLNKTRLAKYLGISVSTLDELMTETRFPKRFWRGYWSRPQIDHWLLTTPQKTDAEQLGQQEGLRALASINQGGNHVPGKAVHHR